MNRLTVKKDNTYEADDPKLCIARLGRLEDYIDTLQQQLDRISRQMDVLSKQGKVKTATYQQLLANRSSLRNQLTQIELFTDTPPEEKET